MPENETQQLSELLQIRRDKLSELQAAARTRLFRQNMSVHTTV